MPVQVTPFKGSRLTEIAARAEGIKDRREGLRLQDLAIQQRGEQNEFNRQATTAQVGQAQQRLDMAAQKLQTDRQGAEREMIASSIDAAREMNPQASPEQLKQQAAALYGQLLGDPEYAAQRFSDAPIEIFQTSPSRADVRADEQLGLQREGLDLRRQQVEATNQNNSLLDNARLRKAEADATVAEGRVVESQNDLIQQQKEVDAARKTKDSIVALAQELLGNKKGVEGTFGNIGGRIINFTQNSQNAESQLNKLTNLLTLENLDKLTGVLSDSDIKLLRSASSLLSDRTIGDDVAIRELQKLAGVDENMSQSGTIDRSGSTVSTQSGATIVFDE